MKRKDINSCPQEVRDQARSFLDFVSLHLLQDDLWVFVDLLNLKFNRFIISTNTKTLLITAPKWSCGKVMFSSDIEPGDLHPSPSLSHPLPQTSDLGNYPSPVTSGGDLWRLVYLGTYPPPPPRSDSCWWKLKLKHVLSQRRQYASYWHAVLFQSRFKGNIFRHSAERFCMCYLRIKIFFNYN